VFGAAVYSAGSTSVYSCPGVQGSSGDGLPPRPATQVSGQGGLGSFGPLAQTMNLARHTAVGRMITECAELGGHGVVGVVSDVVAGERGNQPRYQLSSGHRYRAARQTRSKR